MECKKDLDGNRTLTVIRKAFEKKGITNQSLLQFELATQTINNETVDTDTGEIRPGLCIHPDFEAQPLYQFWHLLYSIDDPAILNKNLIEKYNFNEAQARAIGSIDFNKAGYGSLSSRAIRKILPYQMEGKLYDKACFMAGYNHSNSMTKEENEERQLNERLELIKKGRLRNPVVEKILNHTINLVNAILEEPKYGRPDEIRIELARELTQNSEQRKNTYKRNNDTEKRHKEIKKILEEELHFTSVSRSDIERYKLWEEFGQMSPYQPAVEGNTTKPIKLSDLFNGAYDIDHIIPRSRVFDDSFQNKVLCPREINLKKGQMTAFDYMQSLGEATGHSYTELVTQFYKNGKITKAKFNRLMMTAKEIPSDFINRQLNETQYIAKEVKGMLTSICRNVYATSGSVTDYQRHHWGYEQITQTLNWDRYESSNLTSIETQENGQRIYRIEGWSKRDDQRHHAIDALVIASTRQSTIQRLNNLNQIVENKAEQNTRDSLLDSDLLGVKEYVVNQCPFSESEVTKAVANILVSYKTGKRVAIKNKNTYKHKNGEKFTQITLTPRGYLHKETIYGKIKEIEKIKLSSRFTDTSKCCTSASQAYLNEILEKAGNEPKKAFSPKGLSLIEDELKLSPIPGLSVIDNIIEVDCYKKTFVVRKPVTTITAKNVNTIIDPVIRNIVQERIIKKGEKDAFKDLDNNPIWFDQKRGIRIKSVRILKDLKDLIPIHKSASGITFPPSLINNFGNSIDYVETQNNHHIALYRNQDGKLFESVVTFWDALNRKKYGIPVIIKNPTSVLDYILEQGIEQKDLFENLPGHDWQFITSLQQNEMFIQGLSMEEINTLMANYELDIISRRLYRVQKIGSKDYFLRLHLETKVDDNSMIGQNTGKYLRIRSLDNFNLIKVRINNLGQISHIGEI